MANPNIKQAYAMINGQRINAVYDESTDTWTVEGTAPAESSWSQPEHVYQITLYAEDNAGNTATMDPSDEEYGEQLKLRVLEKTAPIATITAPTTGSILSEAETEITAILSDEGKSGINRSSLVFKIDTTDHSSAVTWSPVEEGDGSSATITYFATGLGDGQHTIELQITDNDGNVSALDTVSFVVSTAAPSLEITSPVEGLLTNDTSVDVIGIAKPGDSNTTISKVTVNGKEVSLSDSGDGKSFNETVQLTEGENTITIIVTDSVGHTSQVIRHVTCDTIAPIITDVVVESTTVDASGRIKITFKVTDPSDNV